MSLRPRLLSLLLLVALPLQAEWLANIGTICRPGGIAVRNDRIVIAACEELIVLNGDGTYRTARAIDVRTHRGFHIEKMSPAKVGFVASGHDLGENLEIHPVVVRLDENGTVQWTRRIRVKSTNEANFATEAANGDVIAAARDDDALLLVRFSPAGEVKSSVLLDRTDIDSPLGLIATKDGGALVLAKVRNKSAGVTRVGPDGNVKWDVVLGSAMNGGFLYDAVELADGGFIAVGRSRNYRTNDRSGWVARFSKSGQVVWQKLIGGEGEDGLFAITRLSDAEVVAVGGTSSAAGDPDTWMVFLGLDGSVRRELTLGTPEEDGANDSLRGLVATAVNGDVVFASAASLKLFAGRVRDASGACPHTRTVHTQIADGVATVENEGTPLLIDPSITVEPMSVSAHDVSARLTRLCEWTASDAKPAEVHVAAAATAEEDTFAAEIAGLLVARKFADLDTIAADLRKNRTTFDSGASKLRGFYDAFGQHTRVASLGGAQRVKLFKDWTAATQSATSRIALAFHDYEVAWRTRGHGYMDTVLPHDAEEFGRQTDRLLRQLRGVEAARGCDAPCFELQIQTANLGGWSEPLRKLAALDPTYWQAFVSASIFLRPQWGGGPNADLRFAEDAAEATKSALGEIVYAKILESNPYERGSFPVRPRVDWPRMRKGFEDFQRLYPRSLDNARQFATMAYSLARDREAVRSLLATPLLAAWGDQTAHDRMRSWAFAELVEPLGKDLARIRSGPAPSSWPRLVFPIADDGSKPSQQGLLVQTPSGPAGVTAAPTAVTPASMGAPIPEPILLAPSEDVRTALHALKRGTLPVVMGDRLFVVSCTDAAKSCAQRVSEMHAFHTDSKSFQLVSNESIDWPALVGAPVLDDTGAVVGIVLPFSPQQAPPGGRAAKVEEIMPALPR